MAPQPGSPVLPTCGPSTLTQANGSRHSSSSLGGRRTSPSKKHRAGLGAGLEKNAGSQRSPCGVKPPRPQLKLPWTAALQEQVGGDQVWVRQGRSWCEAKPLSQVLSCHSVGSPAARILTGCFGNVCFLRFHEFSIKLPAPCVAESASSGHNANLGDPGTPGPPHLPSEARVIRHCSLPSLPAASSLGRGQLGDH